MIPIVWTLAGTDPSGGAGIQGDLKTIHSLGLYGASVITAVIAQNTLGVRRCEYVAEELVRAQLDALSEDLPPRAIKIGMLGTAGAVRSTAAVLARHEVPVVYDPVMISSSGHALMEAEAMETVKTHLLPRVSLLTPNLPEAEALLGRRIREPAQIEQAARDLLPMGPKSVLLKGGHTDSDTCSDYWTNGRQAAWIGSPRQNVPHTHGTGCTLSSALACALALGFDELDSLVIAKAYVNQGLRLGGGIGHGHGPLAHAGWPSSPSDLPWIGTAPGAPRRLAFPPAGPLGLYPLVEHATEISPLLDQGVTILQLRVKGLPDAALEREIRAAVEAGRRHPGAAVYINDYWREALRCGAYGVHLGQADLATADLEALAAAGLRLGVSASSWADLARLKPIQASYVGLGAVFATGSKAIDYTPLGLENFRRMRAVIQEPVVAIGGISLERAAALKQAGADGFAVISDLADLKTRTQRIQAWQQLLAR